MQSEANLTLICPKNTKMESKVCPSPHSTPFCAAVYGNPILEFLYRLASFSRFIPTTTRYIAQPVIFVGLVWTPIEFGHCFLTLHLFVTPFPLTCCSLNPFKLYTIIGRLYCRGRRHTQPLVHGIVRTPVTFLCISLSDSTPWYVNRTRKKCFIALIPIA